jgi:hypothetical protein
MREPTGGQPAAGMQAGRTPGAHLDFSQSSVVKYRGLPGKVEFEPHLNSTSPMN